MFFAIVVAWVGFIAITIAAFNIAKHIEQETNVRERRHTHLYNQDNE